MNPISQQSQNQYYNSTPVLSAPPITRNVAEELLQPNKFSLASLDERRKLYVGKIPKGISDELMERLLRCCGNMVLWKRSTDASGEPKAFGFAEYDSIEGIFAALKILNNLPLLENRLLVKADEKTTQFVNDWKDLKKADWISK